MWLCVENPLNLDKSIICVTFAKKDPKHWTVRKSSDRRTIGGSYFYVRQSNMDKAAFQASLTEEKLSEIELDIGSEKYCRITGLVNYETNQVYALHGVIHIQTESEETVAWAEACMRLDYEAVVEEE